MTTVTRNQGKKENGLHHRNVLVARRREVAPRKGSDDIHRTVIAGHNREIKSPKSSDDRVHHKVLAKGGYASILLEDLNRLDATVCA